MKSLNLLKKYFSQILRTKRAELNLTMGKMSEICGISSRTYEDLEHGKRLPEFVTLINMSIKFKIDLNAYIALITEQGYVVTDKNAQ